MIGLPRPLTPKARLQDLPRPVPLALFAGFLVLTLLGLFAFGAGSGSTDSAPSDRPAAGDTIPAPATPDPVFGETAGALLARGDLDGTEYRVTASTNRLMTSTVTLDVRRPATPGDATSVRAQQFGTEIDAARVPLSADRAYLIALVPLGTREARYEAGGEARQVPILDLPAPRAGIAPRAVAVAIPQDAGPWTLTAIDGIGHEETFRAE